ncbi:MAG: FtsQ-type POTRA domain-containing protein [Clostridia bacterium]|nr:FtsQ-type POTRA domain-containing protein [Clostridia bacterium]
MNKTPEINAMRRKERLIRVLFVLATLVLVASFLAFCRIKTVTVDGNVYTKTEDILSSASIKIKSHIYSIDKDAIEAKIKSTNPYVTSVLIRRKFPATLRLIITEDKPLFYSLIGESFYVISYDLRVLETAETPNEFSSRGLTPLILPEVKKAELGKKLVFASDSDYEKNTAIIHAVMSSSMAENITSVDISSRFNINIMYKSKYTVVFGNAEGMEKKLSFCIKTIKYLEETMPGVSGVIHAEKTDETSFEITGTVG